MSKVGKSTLPSTKLGEEQLWVLQDRCSDGNWCKVDDSLSVEDIGGIDFFARRDVLVPM
jgi:hypothetical protein